MFNTQTQQPPYAEQLVTSVIDGLEKLAEILPYEFDETIDTIEGLYALKFQSPWDKPLTKEQLRNTTICPRHKTFLVPEEYGDVDADNVCPKCEQEIAEQSFIDRYAGKTEVATQQVRELYSEEESQS